MLTIVSSEKLPFEFALGQPMSEILDGLTSAFIELYGEEVYTKSSMIIIHEENFFNIIKNIYGVPVVGQHNDLLEDTILDHLSV